MRFLRAQAGKARGQHELQFGAEQPDRLGARLAQMRQIDQQAGVHVQADLDAVQGEPGKIAQRAILVLAAGAQARLFRIGGLDVGRRAQLHFAGGAVDDDRVALLGDLGNIRDVADGGDRQGARDDGDVARRPGFLQHDAAQAGAIVVEQRRRAHRARDENGVFRQFAGQQNEALARQLMQQPIGDVGQVVQAVAQIGVGLTLQPGARVVLHPLDRRLGRQPAGDRLAQAAQPTAVVGDHPERLEHLAMLAGGAVVAAVDQFVDRGAHRLDRRLQPIEFERDVVGDDLGHDDARLMQDDVAEAEAVGDARRRSGRPAAASRSARPAR